MVLTYRYRIKDAASGRHPRRQAREVNRVWNYCGEIENGARRHNRRWPSGFDLIKLTRGSGQLLGLHSDTVQAVCKRFAISRDACGKRPRWRGRKSLGWVPFQAPRAIRVRGDRVTFLGRGYRLWLSRPLEGKIHCGGRFPTQVCSACGARGGPQGREGLVIREWICNGCGARHDRDIDSAINLLVSGRNVGLQQTQIPSLQGGRR
ncbi:MAG: transposase [Proteobacteria bacterium]|nr:transposase [Pseudomonadota bacterium]